VMSPANPSGTMMGREALARLAETCRRSGIWFISDEIYHGLTYDAPAETALAAHDGAVIVNSFSKYYCMTGWRIGWMVVPDALIRRVEMLQQNLFISAPSLSQVAARAALGERDHAEAQKARYAANRALLAEGLEALGFKGARRADGAFYVYADVSHFTNDSMIFCLELLERAGIASAPGVDFDRTEGHRFLRFSYAGSGATIAQALDRLHRHLAAGG